MSEKLPSYAAGIKAVAIATKMILNSMKPGKAFHLLGKLNQKNGIDCPGCAWPDPKKRSKLGEYCENGVKAIAEEATDSTIGNEFFAKYSIDELYEQSDYWLGQKGRLTQPMILEDGKHYRPISWDKAFQTVAEHLNQLNNPDEAIFYTSGRTSNEAAFLYQLFVRMYGTNNLPDCSNMCHESSGIGLNQTLGIGKGSTTLDDFEHAEVILIFGQNPGTNHPRMLSALEKAKAKGAKVISINPLKEAGLVKFKNPQHVKGAITGAKISDQYLQIQINEDASLLKAIMIKLLALEEERGGVLDQEFIGNKTVHFDQLKEDLDQYDFNELVERTGLAVEEINSLIELIATKKNIIACWCMGLTQHVNGVDNIREVVNLLLLKGSIGKPGAGTCPVRGHSNVQGDRTVGIWENAPEAWLKKLGQKFDFSPKLTPGHNVVEAIEAMHEGKAKVFMGLGGNFISATPDTELTESAMRSCDLTLHVSTKLNRSHLVTGKKALILPCLGRTDKHIENGKAQFVTVENSMGVVHTSYGQLSPVSDQLKSEPSIVAGIAAATLSDSSIDWTELTNDYDKIRDLIETVVDGFKNYNQRIKEENGFELPNGPRNGIFNTKHKKAVFTVNQLAKKDIVDHPFKMMTIRSHDQFNTTIYGLDDRYRDVYQKRKVVFMNRQDIIDQGLKESNKVNLFNRYEGKLRKVDGFEVKAYDIPKGCIATYFPEANPLVPLHVHARESYTPASKSIRIDIEKAIG